MVLATVFTFFATWFLHIVQWFWIRRSFLLQWNDVIFWAIFGAAGDRELALRDATGTRAMLSRGRARCARAQAWSFARSARSASICMLWSFWTAESITDWRLMMRAATVVPEWWRPLDVALVRHARRGHASRHLRDLEGWGAVDQRPLVRAAPATICDHGCRALSGDAPRLSSASTAQASSIRSDRRR